MFHSREKKPGQYTCFKDFKAVSLNKENWYSIFLPKNNDIGAIQLLKVEGVKVHFSIHCEKSVKCI